MANGLNVNGTTRTSTPALAVNPQLEKARSASVLSAAPSPSPSTQAATKEESAPVASPAVVPQPQNALNAGQATTMVPTAATGPVFAPIPIAPPQPITNPLVNGYMDQKHPRRPGKGKSSLPASL